MIECFLFIICEISFIFYYDTENFQEKNKRPLNEHWVPISPPVSWVCLLFVCFICLFGSNWCNIQPQLWAAIVRDWSQRGCSISNMPTTLFNDECQERVLCSLSLSLSLHMCVCLECSYACLLRKIMNIVVLHNNEAINNKCLKRLESYSYIILISFSSAVICFRSHFSYR